MLVNINFEERFIDECCERMKEHCTPEDLERYAPKSFGDMFEKVETGIYSTGLNFDHTIDMFSTDKIKDEWDSFTYIKKVNGEVDWKYIRECMEAGMESKSNYGVCDNYQQVIDYYPELQNENRKFALSVCKILKNNQPKRDGWRWHKWGEYIGTQEPQREYIYDEPIINEVYVYHIYELL